MSDEENSQILTSFSQNQMLARSKLWTSELNKLLRKWKKQIGKREQGHLNLVRKYRQRHYFFGIPSTIITVIVSAGVFSALEQWWIRIVIGNISLFSTALIAFQTFMNYQGKAEQHKSAADDYGSIFRLLDTMLLIPGSMRGNPIITLQDLRKQFDDLIRRSPTLPKKYDTELAYEVINPKKQQELFPEDKNLDKIFAQENDYDTSDEEYEVCIAFDLDKVECHNMTTATSYLTARHNENIQRTLNFKLQHLEKSRDTPPPVPPRITKTKSTTL